MYNYTLIFRFLSDMGEALDWVRQISLENNWKTLKIRIGPGVYFLVGSHPEAAQVMLRSGQEEFSFMME